MEAIIKTLDVLELFPDYKTEMSLGEVVKASGLNRTTVYRIVSTLAKRGYLKQQKRRGKYSLGIRCQDLGGGTANMAHDKYGVIAYLLDLSKLINATIHLNLWKGSDILFNKTSESYNEPFKKFPVIWKEAELHCTAAGKVLLSAMSDEDLKKYFNSKKTLKKFTPNTITNINQLKKQIISVRREGIATEMEEQHPGINGIAAMIRNYDGEIIGAVNVVGLVTNLTPDLLNAIKPTIKLCAMKISQEQGTSIRY